MSHALLAIQNILQNSNIFIGSRETVLFTSFGKKKLTQSSGLPPTSVSYLKESTLKGMKFPPSQEDINEEAAPIPDMLYNFLGWLLSQSNECKELNKEKITMLSETMHHKWCQ